MTRPTNGLSVHMKCVTFCNENENNDRKIFSACIFVKNFKINYNKLNIDEAMKYYKVLKENNLIYINLKKLCRCL